MFGLLQIAGFPPPAEYYDSALKTPFVSSVLHRVPPTAEIIHFFVFSNLFNVVATGALQILAKDPSPWLLSTSSAAADLHEHLYIRAAEGTHWETGPEDDKRFEKKLCCVRRHLMFK